MFSQQYKCESCKARFLSKESLERHISTQGFCHGSSLSKEYLKKDASFEEKTPLSIICSVKLPTKEKMNMKIMYDHEKKEMLRIDTSCNEVTTKENLKNQEMTQSKCEETSDKTLEDGNIRPLSYEKQVFRCQIQICKAEFVSNQLLQNHYKLDHPSKCESCKLIFTLRSHLKHHIKSVHETKKPFKCGSCNAKFSKKVSLIQHIKVIHQTNRVFKCTICYYFYISQIELNKHVGSVHVIRKPRLLPIYERTKRGKSPVQYTICKKRLHTQHGLKSQNLPVHENKQEINPENETDETLVQIFECEKCKADFNSIGKLRDHIKLFHEKKKSFDIYLSEEEITESSSVENKPTKFQNDAIFEKLILNQSSKTHVPLVYERIKQFKCNKCKASFKVKSGLKKHVKIVHEKKKAYKCGICEEDFFAKWVWSKHVNKFHDGKEPLNCQFCENGFLTEYSLKSHCLLAHDGNKSKATDAKPMGPENDNPSTPRMGYWMKRIAKIQNRKVKWLEKQKLIKDVEK